MLSIQLNSNIEPPSSSSPPKKRKHKNVVGDNKSNGNELAPFSSSSSSSSSSSKHKQHRCELNHLRSQTLSQAHHDQTHSHPLSFPLLTKLTLPPVDLTDLFFRTFLLRAPNLVDLTLTHRPILQITLVSLLGNVSAVLHTAVDWSRTVNLEGCLKKLRRLKYRYEIVSTELEEQQQGNLERGDRSSFLRQMLEGVRGVGLVSLTVMGLFRVTKEELEVLAESCEMLEELEMRAAFWEEDSIVSRAFFRYRRTCFVACSKFSRSLAHTSFFPFPSASFFRRSSPAVLHPKSSRSTLPPRLAQVGPPSGSDGTSCHGTSRVCPC